MTLDNISVAVSKTGVRSTHCYVNVPANNVLAKLSSPLFGEKDGAHFLRCELQVNNMGICLPRNGSNTQSLARLLIIDCDKSYDSSTGVVDEQNAPNPFKIHEILKLNKIWHVIYGSYSYYTGFSRYRILFITKKPYTKTELAPTVDQLIKSINDSLSERLLVNSTENCTWAQPWYIPRKPHESKIDTLYLEHTDGAYLDVIEPVALIQQYNTPKLFSELPNADIGDLFNSSLEISSIQLIKLFNAQYPLNKILSHYGYRKVYETPEYEKWISPNSKSGQAGITHWFKQGKFYSHHDDQFHDGKPHDAFDLFQVKENLSRRDALINVSKCTFTPNGISIDEHNKMLFRNRRTGQCGRQFNKT